MKGACRLPHHLACEPRGGLKCPPLITISSIHPNHRLALLFAAGNCAPILPDVCGRGERHAVGHTTPAAMQCMPELSTPTERQTDGWTKDGLWVQRHVDGRTSPGTAAVRSLCMHHPACRKFRLLLASHPRTVTHALIQRCTRTARTLSVSLDEVGGGECRGLELGEGGKGGVEAGRQAV